MMGMYGFGPGAMLASILVVLLFLGGLIAVVVWAVRQFAGGGRASAQDPTAIWVMNPKRGACCRSRTSRPRRGPRPALDPYAPSHGLHTGGAGCSHDLGREPAEAS